MVVSKVSWKAVSLVEKLELMRVELTVESKAVMLVGLMEHYSVAS